MGTRIDALPATALPNRAHVVPAMREGLTVRLTIAQILGLVLATDVPVDDDDFDTLTADSLQAVLEEIDAELTSSVLRKNGNLSGLSSVDTSLTNLGFTTLGKTLRAVADAAAGRTAIGAAPVTVAGTGVGGLQTIASSTGAALVLPANGIWEWRADRFVSSSGIWAGTKSAGIDPGGTTVMPATAGVQYTGWAKRIS